MELFEALGFRWDRSAVPVSVAQPTVAPACFRFHKMLPKFVWDASVLEGNPFTWAALTRGALSLPALKDRSRKTKMNGVLLSHGIDAISVPARKVQAFNEKMVRFYRSMDASEMMEFLWACHPEHATSEAAILQPESGDTDLPKPGTP